MIERRIKAAERALARVIPQRKDHHEDDGASWLPPAHLPAHERLALHVMRLCDARALPSAIRQTAQERAERRATLMHRYPVCGLWPRGTLAPLIDEELRILHAMLAESEDFFGAVRAWADQPDVEGWPLLWSGSSAPPLTGCAALEENFARWRQRQDSQRSQDCAREWRAQHPEWRRDLPIDEFLEFDMRPLLKPDGNGAGP